MPFAQLLRPGLIGWASVCLVAGLVLRAAGQGGLAEVAWVGATLPVLVALLVEIVRALYAGEIGLDLIAAMSMSAALAVGEPLAAAVVAVMYAGGQALEAFAERRAKSEMTALLSRVPRQALRRRDDRLEEVPLDAIVPGDLLVIRRGDVVPVDGRVAGGTAVLDLSALTGESLPQRLALGDAVMSGASNAGDPFDLEATYPAAESTFAGIVRLVRQAQAARAPMTRMADRAALGFLAVTLVLAGGAWAASGDPIRAVAVLVVATPCPLILAVPVALVAGLSQAAAQGILIKGGRALEALAAVRGLVVDKTGTLTDGRPGLLEIRLADGMGADELLRLAASLDQASAHVLAGPIVTAATARGLVLTLPDDVVETHGQGVAGTVDGRAVWVGRLDWITGPHPDQWARQVRRRADLDGSLAVLVEVDGAIAAALLLHDPIRPDAPRMVRALRGAGIRRVVLATGDRADVAAMVGRVVGVDTVLADCDPADKLRALTAEAKNAPTVMVGDGINDAPALAAASVGVALAARGATASSEAADVVLTVDRVDALADAILVARRSRGIARQAVAVGMGLSLVAMVAAAAGLLAPAVGAALQEVIDVLAIGVALRAVLPGRLHSVTLAAKDRETLAGLREEHDALGPLVERVGQVADALTTHEPDLAEVHALMTALDDDLLPHEREDERVLLPLVARALGSTDAVAALSRTHAEIEHQVARLHRLLSGIDDEARGGDAVAPEDVVELRRLLYGLYAILRLHNAQEDEGAMSLTAV